MASLLQLPATRAGARRPPHQLGRGAIRQTGRPPLSGEQFVAIEQATVWEQAPVPAGCWGFDKYREM